MLIKVRVSFRLGDVPIMSIELHPRLSQRVGMCVPSGCSAADVYGNYAQLYGHINAKLESTNLVRSSLTEDYFYEGYYEGSNLPFDKNILPETWTWGQSLYV